MIEFHVKFFVFLVVLNLKCDAKININITTASHKGAVKIRFGGAHNKLITNEEISIFNVTEDNLKYGVRVELGRIPEDVFLKEPTPYKNLYQKYKWKQVHRNVQIKRAQIDDIIYENVVLNDVDHINNTTNITEKKMELYMNVDNTMKSFWSSDGLPDDEIPYTIGVTFNIKKFNFENKWRNDNFRTIALNFGVKTYGVISIPPGKIVTVKLLAKKTIIVVKVMYVASLTGQVIANYAREYGKHHFWAPAILDIMKAAKLNNEIITTESIEIKCYTDPIIDVRDKVTGEKIPMRFNKAPIVPYRKQKQKKRVVFKV